MRTRFLVIPSILVIAFFSLLLVFFSNKTKIAYINNSKLMIGFSEAAFAERELKTENEKWQKQLQNLQDSLKAAMDTMTKEYDNATPARKKELQDILSARNQQVNNFRQANIRKMEELRQKKFEGIIEKINLYITEYGKKNRYSIILGTGSGGSILYGSDQIDITEKIVAGLNERYK